MSTINTSSLNTNYPTPGINNSTQGFRDNFNVIKSSLDTAASEISDIQTKAVLKSALNGTTIDNDMGNTIISNAATKGFRSTSYNMGSSLPAAPEAIIVDVSKADVHFGVVTTNTSFIFAGWSPALTQSSIELHLFIANPQGSINFPNTTYNSSSEILSGATASVRSCENYSSLLSNGTPITITTDTDFAPGGVGITHTNTVGIPAGVKELQFRISSLDCGTTFDVQPLNTARKAGAIEVRTPTGLGMQGDTLGTICTDGSRLYICMGNYDGETTIWKMTGDAALVNAPT
jgi:hypothetical protein